MISETKEVHYPLKTLMSRHRMEDAPLYSHLSYFIQIFPGAHGPEKIMAVVYGGKKIY